MRGKGAWTRGRVFARTWVVDIAIAVALCVVSLLLAHQAPPIGWHQRDAVGYLLTAVINLLLAVRRRVPVTVLLVCAGLWTGYIAAGYWPVVNSPALLTALYTVVEQCSVPMMWAAALLVAVIWDYAGVNGQAGSVWSALAQSVVIPPIICWFGRIAHRLAESNEQLRRSQEERTRRAVVDERIRLARELHDVVAHHLAVISVQAGLAQYVVASDTGTAHRALGTVLEVSAEALGELRRILELLRVDYPDDPAGPETGGERAAAPGTARLGELIDRTRNAGVPVEFTVEGTEFSLPAGVDRTVFRVAQEALTNVIKHADCAATSVILSYGTHADADADADTISIRIRDQGRPDTAAARAATAGGHGLPGMRERARLFGGTLTAGPRPDRGFEVLLTLPVRPPADGG